MVILTEGGYTTAEGPMTKVAAIGNFDRWASFVTPFSDSHMRVLAETEYRRLVETGHLSLGD